MRGERVSQNLCGPASSVRLSSALLPPALALPEPSPGPSPGGGSSRRPLPPRVSMKPGALAPWPRRPRLSRSRRRRHAAAAETRCGEPVRTLSRAGRGVEEFRGPRRRGGGGGVHRAGEGAGARGGAGGGRESPTEPPWSAPLPACAGASGAGRGPSVGPPVPPRGRPLALPLRQLLATRALRRRSLQFRGVSRGGQVDRLPLPVGETGSHTGQKGPSYALPSSPRRPCRRPRPKKQTRPTQGAGSPERQTVRPAGREQDP